MRTPIIAGNWKMNKTVEESTVLAKQILEAAGNEAAEMVICPTFLALDRVGQLIKGSKIKLGAQDVHWEDQGAFTGKVSVDMLSALGVEYVIIGHSEQRSYFHETNQTVNLKMKKVLGAGLKPILCVGETLEQREASETEKVVEAQVKGGFAGISAQQASICVIAYEPVWAIGTGKTATDEMAQDVHAYIRKLLKDLYGSDTSEAVRIQYGGSMKPDNAAGLLAQSDIDGGLIGGAALKADSFLGIIKAVQK